MRTLDAEPVTASSGPRRVARTLHPMRWIVHGERTLYSSPWVGLRLADVEIPGGERFDHHVVRVPREAAGCVVHDPERGVLLLWRHRFITDTWGWEIPAGATDDGESPAEAAAREVHEETGWRPGPVEHLVTYQPTNGLSDQRFHVFLAGAPSTRAIPSTSARPSESRGDRRPRCATTSPATRSQTACRSRRCCSRWPTTGSGRPARSTRGRPGCTRGMRSTCASGARPAAPRCSP